MAMFFHFVKIYFWIAKEILLIFKDTSHSGLRRKKNQVGKQPFETDDLNPKTPGTR